MLSAAHPILMLSAFPTSSLAGSCMQAGLITTYLQAHIQVQNSSTVFCPVNHNCCTFECMNTWPSACCNAHIYRPHLKQGPSGFVGVLAALVGHDKAVHLLLLHKDAVHCLLVCLLCCRVQIYTSSTPISKADAGSQGFQPNMQAS